MSLPRYFEDRPFSVRNLKINSKNKAEKHNNKGRAVIIMDKNNKQKCLSFFWWTSIRTHYFFGTATYHIAKYLAALLSPLSKSEFTVSSTNKIVEILKHNKVPKDCRLVSFDVTGLLTNVPLQYTIDVILRKIYNEKLVNTDIPKKCIKDLLLFTKNVHFTFDDNTQEIGWNAMGTPFGPVIARIFVVHHETKVVPTLKKLLCQHNFNTEFSYKTKRELSIFYICSDLFIYILSPEKYKFRGLWILRNTCPGNIYFVIFCIYFVSSFLCSLLDEVKFGERVDAPPTFTAAPRNAAKNVVSQPLCFKK